MDDEQLIVLLIDIGRVNAQAGEDGILQQLLQRVAPGRQVHEQGREHQQAQEQIKNGFVRGTVHDSVDDTDNEKRKGHVQQQGLETTAVGDKRGKDAVKRGHDERSGWALWGGKRGRCVEQQELRRVIADRLRELGVLLFGQRLNLFLLVVAVLDVLHRGG